MSPRAFRSEFAFTTRKPLDRRLEPFTTVAGATDARERMRVDVPNASTVPRVARRRRVAFERRVRSA